ncbi:MAG: ribbon-helix-helix domain-containing protein [Alphaproteobacteria bacterium]|jgi:predicted DNA-binding ribbon-helix-helix protein|nr:MAG: ribbon-helix-helix domain-containing protein [Alphaproteobacteria bacterium]
MKSVVVKRTVIVQGHKTSVNLEHAFWRGLKEVAAWRDMTLSDLLNSIDSERHDEDLSSAIRLVVLNFYRHQLFAADHLLRSVAPLPNIVA